MHWTDSIVRKIVAEKGDKAKYTVAAGITPSGSVHIGNFREIMTVDLVKRALEFRGKKVRFIYSWDDYDVFRKVPKNMPKQDMLNKNLRKPIVDVPDPFGREESYARYHEVNVEEDVARVGIKPEFLYQAKKYRALKYVNGIKVALQHTKEIKDILNEYRKIPLEDDWMPLTGFCPDCGKDEVSFSDYDGKNKIKMFCDECGESKEIEISKSPFLKLPWRVDWPMRWDYEKVDFEPGGKDHSTEGGSFSTCKEIVKLYDWTAPTYLMYNFISIKGGAGKISSSSGEVITLRDCLDVYEPAMVRWLFAGTRPGAEFAIGFDLEVIKNYEDFDKCERIYFKEQDAKNDKEFDNQKRIYELSVVDKVPKKMPFQPSFRHLTTLVQIYEGDLDAVAKDYGVKGKDAERVKVRAQCALNWLKMYAPDDIKFNIVKKISKKLTSKEKEAIKLVLNKVDDKMSDKDLHEEIYTICKSLEYEPKDFFKLFYNVLIEKDKGPKLAAFLLVIGRKRLVKILGSI
ncbi:lysine--tRNA ligase [archaeon]|jgi:lysyl-tRNA synthetase, class I|nr:lysine--tRNA ligase [archaeon]MBT4397473.1 lysine--tRNA ligase [archaeon]MBT4440868.1 lysine--tRNA ligase [archaeon]